MSVDDIYISDAYHSLSIEGYLVSPELIERVRSGHWDPDHHDDDRKGRDALAARGYWQAFQIVKESIARILVGEDPGALVRTAHGEWYRELFQPSVAAGLIPASVLAGYRNEAVFLRNSRHVPRVGKPYVMRWFAPISATGSLVISTLTQTAWTRGPLHDERHAGLRRLSVDHYSP